MKFDTLIIGGGLAGLTCGIELLKQKQRCMIVSTGQSALHFNSGSLELLNQLPNGVSINSPLSAYNDLLQQAPSHPYNKFDKTQFLQLTERAKSNLTEAGLSIVGSAYHNHYRITPMGYIVPSWLSLKDATTLTDLHEWEGKTITLINLHGFLDFQPQLVADKLIELGINTQVTTLQLPQLDLLRQNPSEFRSTGIANILEHTDNEQMLIQALSHIAKTCDLILLPACIGLNKPQYLQSIRNHINKPIMMLPTMPPSLFGIRIHQHLMNHYRSLGGDLMMGDTVTHAECNMQHCITQVYTHNHGDIPLIADNFVLASGSFFSHGLESSPTHIFEPIFNLDIEKMQDRNNWSNDHFFSAQPYMKFGVNTDQQFKPSRQGNTFHNLYAIGAILSGFDALSEGCGAGVSILTALAVSDIICAK